MVALVLDPCWSLMVGVEKPAARAGPEDQHCQYCQIQLRFEQLLVYSHSERQLLLVTWYSCRRITDAGWLRERVKWRKRRQGQKVLKDKRLKGAKGWKVNSQKVKSQKDKRVYIIKRAKGSITLQQRVHQLTSCQLLVGNQRYLCLQTCCRQISDTN